MEGQRFKLRFKDPAALEAALSIQSEDIAPAVVNRKRRYISVTGSDGAGSAMRSLGERTMTAAAMNAVEILAREFGAEIVPDYQYELDTAPTWYAEAEDADSSLDDVVRLVRAEGAWAVTRGAGVTIAVVDTGIDGRHPEFPFARRAGGWALPGEDPWTDWQGHGTMCACIAAASDAEGGRYTGIAPEAKIMSCRTRFFDSELGAIYDELTDRARAGEIIVASNSFGQRTGTAPQPPQDSDFLPALDDALAAGVTVVFSAGNNHQFAGGSPAACQPNSIWLHKSRADILAVATCKLDETMWFYSSRGPGQHHGAPNTNEKPDVTAPTPENGRILYGPGDRVLADGWGTSGACPQVAGLAALIRSARPTIGRDAVFALFKDQARPLHVGPTCAGRGIIDCVASINAMGAV